MAILDDILSQLPQGAETSPWAKAMLARMASGDMGSNPNDVPTPAPQVMPQPRPTPPPAYPSPTAPKLPDNTPVPAPRMAAAQGFPPIPETATGLQTFQAGLAGLHNGGLLGGIAGAMGADDVIRERANTYRTLVANGVKPEAAALLIRQPDLFKEMMASQQQAKTETRQNETAAWLTKKYNIDPALANAVVADPHLMQTYLAPGGPGSSSEYGLTPYFDEAGKAYFPNKSGQLKQANVSLLPPGSKAEQEAAGKVRGKTLAQAQADLPKIEANAATTMRLVDSVLSDPYLNRMIGPLDQYLPNVSPSANEIDAKLKQLAGGAFLEAYQSLRGGGAITEMEGAKAEAAMSRIKSRGVSEDAYRQALQELRDIARNGVIRAQIAAGKRPASDMDQITNLETLAPETRAGLKPQAPSPGRDPLATATNPGTGSNPMDRVNPDLAGRMKSAQPPAGEYVFNPATGKLEPKR